jgi:two-component system, LytTR family, sensor kinase
MWQSEDVLGQSDISLLSISPKIRLMAKRNDCSFPTFWRLQALGWSGLYALTMLDALPYISREPSWLWRRVGGNSIACATLFLASCILRPICRSLAERALPWFQLQFRAFCWSSLLGGTVAFLVQLIVLHFPEPNWTDLISNYLRYSIFLLFWCNLYFSIKQWQRSIQEREHLSRVEGDAREARLSALRYQLDPHFLFNSLNAVSTLAVEGDIPAVTRMLAQIGDLLRVSLDGGRPLEIAFSEEINFTERYLAIEQTQFGERLQVEWSIATETLNAAVPSMLLQPLIENAVRHGIAPVVEGGKIAIHSAVNGLTLQILINNTGPRNAQPNKTGTGIGLANTVERLRTLYGPNQRLNLQWPEAGGCGVCIEIPFRRAPERLEELACAH